MLNQCRFITSVISFLITLTASAAAVASPNTLLETQALSIPLSFAKQPFEILDRAVVIDPVLQFQNAAEELPPLRIRFDGIDAESEIQELENLRERILREQKTPGAGKLPLIVFISDQHGDIEKFDYLLLDAFRQVLPPGSIPDKFVMNFDQPLQEQFKAIGVDLQDIKERLFIHNLGDFMDRGPFGLKILVRSEQLLEAGLSDYVSGNHDLWAGMNLWGFHLPYYEKYEFYGYSDVYSDFTKETVAAFHQRMLNTHSNARDRNWWAERLAEYTIYHRERQKSRWSALDVQINGPYDAKKKRIKGKGVYAQVSATLETDKQKKLWDRFRGNMFKSEIFTGVRAVGEMSVGWWDQLLSDFEAEYEGIAALPDFDAESPAADAWKTAIRLMRVEILPEVTQDLHRHVNAGAWEWRIFEALNNQNYRSPEWWAKDWIFHEGWGTSVLKELNASIQDPQLKVTTANYLKHPLLQRAARFYKREFNLTVRDLYLNRGAHAFLPTDKNGLFTFTYRPIGESDYVTYKGESVWEGLERIAEDVRNPNYTFAEIYPALSLVNSWYADETTVAKVPNVAELINRHREDDFSNENGFDRFFTGHLPFFEFYTKLSDDKRGRISGFQTGGRIIFTDHGMAEKFGSRGATVRVGADGLYLRGWPTHDTPLNEIHDHPKTAEWNEGSIDVYFENDPVTRDSFLEQLLGDIDTRLQNLQKSNLNQFRHPRLELAA